MNTIVRLLFDAQLLAIPLSALIITQLIKVTIDRIQKGQFSFKLRYMNYYGGMPSAHSALFAALVVTTLMNFGWYSFEFAISVILYLIVVRDAIGIRWHLGNHGKILKQLIHEHIKDNDVIQYEKIVTRLGHRPIEAFVGTLCGIGIAVLMKTALILLL